MSNEGAVTLLGGIGASAFGDTDGDAVYKKFGPFNVCTCCDWLGDGYAVGVCQLLDKFFDVVRNGVELDLSRCVMRGEYKVTLSIIPCGREFDFVSADFVHVSVEGVVETVVELGVWIGCSDV